MLSLGGIPNRTTVCATVNPRGGGQDDTGSINTAISNCPAGQVVQLGAGTFIINNGHVAVNKAITLRGSGPGVTILHSSNGAVLGSYQNGAHSDTIITAGGSGNISNTTTLTTDAAQGSYTIQVTSGSGFKVGGLVHIDDLALGQAMPDCCFNNGTGHVWAMSDYRVEWNAHSPAVRYFDSTDYNNNFTRRRLRLSHDRGPPQTAQRIADVLSKGHSRIRRTLRSRWPDQGGGRMDVRRAIRDLITDLSTHRDADRCVASVPTQG
jgi:hypothetical protein